MEIVLSSSFSSDPITKGQSLLGPTLSSEISSNVNESTAIADQVNCAVPLFWTPVVCVGSLPEEAVVPFDVTS